MYYTLVGSTDYSLVSYQLTVSYHWFTKYKHIHSTAVCIFYVNSYSLCGRHTLLSLHIIQRKRLNWSAMFICEIKHTQLPHSTMFKHLIIIKNHMKKLHVEWNTWTVRMLNIIHTSLLHFAASCDNMIVVDSGVDKHISSHLKRS